jgi:hypothetical protein
MNGPKRLKALTHSVRAETFVTQTTVPSSIITPKLKAFSGVPTLTYASNI